MSVTFVQLLIQLLVVGYNLKIMLNKWHFQEIAWMLEMSQMFLLVFFGYKTTRVMLTD